MMDRRQLLATFSAGAALMAARGSSGQTNLFPVDADTQRYEDLTASELVGMVIGMPLFLKGELHRGRRIIELSLDLEHLISTQPLAPAAAEPDALKEIEAFQRELFQLTGENVFLHILRGTPVAQNHTKSRTRQQGS